MIAGLPVLRWAESGAVTKLPSPRNPGRAPHLVLTGNYSRVRSDRVQATCWAQEPTLEEPGEMLTAMEDH